MAANSDDEVVHDFTPMIKVYKSGRIERLMGLERDPPSLDPVTGVQSKDVIFAPEFNLNARIFLPPNADRTKKLPLVVYFHGGGFVTEDATSTLYQRYLRLLVAEANVVAVSANYRLVPEFPLPIAFEDAVLAFKWATTEGIDEWITDFADPNRLYIAGDSAGGTIAHTTAIRVGSEGVPAGFNFRGLMLNCPFFWGVDEKPLGIETDTDDRVKFWKDYCVRMVPFVCPNVSLHDGPWINPGRDMKLLSSLACKRVLVYTGSLDFLKERVWVYKEALIKSGWEGDVECVEIEGEKHDFSVLFPYCENSVVMLKKVASFFNEYQ